jgi:UPF0271 protein
MGESYGAWHMGDDAALMPCVTSANVACGFHAGDPSTIAATVALALRHGVAIGAHPSLPDLQGFGRRTMQVTEDEVYGMTLYQAGAVRAFVEAAGGRLHHLKAHGALYNMAAKDVALSRNRKMIHLAVCCSSAISGSAPQNSGRAIAFNSRGC